MGIVKPEQIWSSITEIINRADKEFLRQVDDSRLIEEISNELYFVGAYTKYDLERQVVPFMKENANDILLIKEEVLKVPAVRNKKVTTRKKPATKETVKKEGSNKKVIGR